MAIRDKSQSVGFVYTNIYEIYKKAQAAPTAERAPRSDSRVLRAEELGTLKVTRFQPRTLSKATLVAQTQAQAQAQAQAQGTPLAAGMSPFDDLKANLNKLHDLHARLRFMLKELEELVNKK